MMPKVGHKSKADVPELALEDDLIAAIRRDVAALGVVGEEDASLLIYAVATSRILKEPLRIINRGASSGGKSFKQSVVCSMVPCDEVIDATSLTPQALYYKEPGSLTHKVIVKGERSFRQDDDGKNATAALRQLISEGRITKEVTIKGETVRIEQTGPVAFTETTTQKSIFVEDLNRCLQVFTDESPEQTRRIKVAYAKRYLPDAQVRELEEILKRHHEFQNALQPVDVRIPYALHLVDALPDDKLETRRIGKQMLACIEVIAFLNQFTRGPNDDGQLLATLDDYAIARQLLWEPLNHSLGSDVQCAHDGLKAAFPDGEFNSNEVLKAGCFKTKPTRDKWLKELNKQGILRLVAKGRPKHPAKWAWTGERLKSLLPTVEELELVIRKARSEAPFTKRKPR